VFPISRPVLVLQVAGLWGAVWLFYAEMPVLLASGSPGRLIGAAVVYMLAAWICAFGVTLWAFLAVSLDRFQDLFTAAVSGSIHAMWFVPGMLLASAPVTPLAAGGGLLMMANAARLLVANPPPQKRMLSRQAVRGAYRLFGDSVVLGEFVARDTCPALTGAFLIQAGWFGAWAGYGTVSGALVAAGVGSWTWTSMARGAYLPRKRRHPAHTVLSVAIVLFLAIGLSAVRQSEAADGAVPGDGLRAATRLAVRQLIHPPREEKAAADTAKPKERVMRVAAPPIEIDRAGKGGIPGLVLLPTRERPQSVTIPTYRLQITLSPSKPVSIPFTGEYRLFRESTAGLPPGAKTLRGTPLDAIYVTTNGSAMETDAYQEFDPPVDFTPCERIQLTLTSGEVFPASATLILVGQEFQKAAETGPEIFGLNGGRKETIEFLLPPLPRLRVRGLRVVFRHNPMEASHSAQVAIERFTFLPRQL